MALAPINIRGGFVSNVVEHTLRERSALCVNWVEDELGSNVSRPGMTEFCTPEASVLVVDGNNEPPIIGLFAYRDWLIAVNQNRRVFAIDEDGTSRDITGVKVSGGTNPVGFLDDNGVLVMCAGGRPVAWDGTGLTRLHAPDDTSETPSPTHLAIINRYLVANDVGTDDIWYTTTIDHTAWDAGARLFQAESMNDPVVALMAHQNMLYAFGTRTIDVYYPTKVASPAFARGYTVQRGIAGARGVVNVEGAFFFLDDHRRIVRLTDRDPEVISFEIEKTLQGFSRVDDVVAHRIDMDGKHWLVFNFPEERTALVYDYALSKPGASVWYEWRERQDGEWQPMSMMAYAYQPKWNKHFCSSQTLGTIYEFTADAGDDYGNEIMRIRRTGFVDHGATVRKKSKRIRFNMTRGMFDAPSSSESDLLLLVRYRDEDQRWGGYEPVSLGDMGDLDTLGGELTGLGMYRERQWEMVCVASAPRLAMRAPEESFDLLTR